MRRTGSVKKNTGEAMTIFQGGVPHEETNPWGRKPRKLVQIPYYWLSRNRLSKKSPGGISKNPAIKGGGPVFETPPGGGKNACFNLHRGIEAFLISF